MNMTYDSLPMNSPIVCYSISNNKLIYYTPVNMDDATIRTDYQKRRLVLV